MGDKGKLYSTDDYGSRFHMMFSGDKAYKPGDEHNAVRNVAQTIPRSPGHEEEWFEMMRKGTPSFPNTKRRVLIPTESIRQETN